MSRNLTILLVVMCAAIAGLIIFSKTKSSSGRTTDPGHPSDVVTTPTPGPAPAPGDGSISTPTPPAPRPPASATSNVVRVQPPSLQSAIAARLQTGMVARAGMTPVPANTVIEEPEMKPLPVLEKNYLTATNRDDRLDLMMDITDWPGPEAVRALTRLFQAETDPDLKVDLLDSLLGIEGQIEEKLKMLELGTVKGLPQEVRQSAIDGLIDLDDQRVIPILNTLLNDPDEEIREGAKDALEMLQSQPATKLGK